MKAVKPLPKRAAKQDRERKVLLGLIEFYLKTGKPVGSNTLKETGFEDLSSATIRNYFASLEEEGFLTQQHASGGRIPTHQAFRFYAHEYANNSEETPLVSHLVASLKETETKEIMAYLQKVAESLSEMTKCAVFLSAPRFDHDFISSIMLVPVDPLRYLAVIVTNFGLVHTEVLQTEKKWSTFSLRRMESYFKWRLTSHDQPENLEPEEEIQAQTFYNELMVRYIVGYSQFTQEDIYRTGFSTLLVYPEFHEPSALTSSLSLFENAHSMRLLLKECSKDNQLRFWIGDDLNPYSTPPPDCAILGIPYHVNLQAVGAIGLLGTVRMPYRQNFAILRTFSECINSVLTRSLYKFKITFRQPQQGPFYLPNEECQLIGKSTLMLLEDNRFTL